MCDSVWSLWHFPLSCSDFQSISVGASQRDSAVAVVQLAQMWGTRVPKGSPFPQTLHCTNREQSTDRCAEETRDRNMK